MLGMKKRATEKEAVNDLKNHNKKKKPPVSRITEDEYAFIRYSVKINKNEN